MSHFQRAFALHAQAHEEAARLSRRHCAVHECGKAGGGHVRPEIPAFRQCFQNGVNALCKRAFRQKFAGEVFQQTQAVGRQYGFGVELDACPGAILVAQPHDHAFGVVGRNREKRPVRGADGKGMVASYPHGIGQSVEKSLPVMHDFRAFAVYDHGSLLHMPAAEKPQNLMTEADSQHRYGRIQQPEKFKAVARFFRSARPGRDADSVEFGMFGQLQQARIVIFHNQRVLPECVKGLRQIVGEGNTRSRVKHDDLQKFQARRA